MKCIICGKTEKKYNEGMCSSCCSENYFSVDSIKKFPFSYCANCGAYRHGMQWLKKLELYEAIEKSVLYNIKFKAKPEEVAIKINLPEHKIKIGSKAIGEIDLQIKTKLPNQNNKEEFKEEEYIIPIKVSYTLCDTCSKKKTEYFEGRIQLRNKENEQFAEAKKLVHQLIEPRNDVFITKKEELSNGVDFFISSQKYVQNIGNELYKRFGGELTITSKLFSRDKQTSKDLFRVDVLLRLPEFNIGDILFINNKLIKVTAMHEKKIVGVTLKENKSISENIDKGYEIKARNKDAQEVIVTKRKPLEVLHPEDYQSTLVANPEFHKIIGNKAKVIIIDGLVYVI
jgi:nonsense-mediated mRNA decay protein 3